MPMTTLRSLQVPCFGAAALVVCLLSAVQAQDASRTHDALVAKPLSAEDRSRVDWLKEHAVPLRSIDPADDDFADLQPLKEMIGDRRIVQLGEETHGDGATFEAKIRLIKFLHQEMGFDVIAFESGLYDCRKAWQAFKAGEDPDSAAQRGIFGIWTSSEQVQPLIQYLGEAAKTDNPLELAGVDCQFTGLASRNELAQDMGKLCDSLELADDVKSALADCVSSMLTEQDYANDANATKQHAEALQTLSAALNAAQPDEQLSAGDLAFWRQYLKSTVAYQAYRANANPADIAAQVNPRDMQMGDNLIWLAEEGFPNRKIIVWAATFHVVRNPKEIENAARPGMYAEIQTMGHVAHQQLADETFTLGFTAFDGSFGQVGREGRELPAPPDSSLEHLWGKAATENDELSNSVISFHDTSEGADWLRTTLTARPLGYGPMQADWSKCLDGMVFTKTMKPSTFRSGD